MADHVDTIIEQWARERPDVDVSPVAVIGRVSRLARAYDAAIANALRPFGLLPDEYDVLASLRRQGPPYELCPRDLLTTMMISSGTVTHRVDKLVSRGLVERRPDDRDRRMVLARLTPAGKDLIDAAIVAHVENEARLVSALSPAERDRLASLLRRLGQTAGEDTSP